MQRVLACVDANGACNYSIRFPGHGDVLLVLLSPPLILCAVRGGSTAGPSHSETCRESSVVVHVVSGVVLGVKRLSSSQRGPTAHSSVKWIGI